MPEKLALQIIRSEHTAAKSVNKPLLVRLVGGDPLNRFQALKSLCEHAWAAVGDIQFEITVDRTPAAAESETWCRQHGEHLRIWLFRDSLSAEDLQYVSDNHWGVEYRIRSANHDRAACDIGKLLKNYISLRLTVSEVFRELPSVLSEIMVLENAVNLPWVKDAVVRTKAAGGCPTDQHSGRCYDTSGYCWPCVALSPVRLHFVNMNEKRLASCMEDAGLMSWICPGELLPRPDRQHRTIRQLMLRRNVQSLGLACPYLSRQDRGQVLSALSAAKQEIRELSETESNNKKGGK